MEYIKLVKGDEDIKNSIESLCLEIINDLVSQFTYKKYKNSIPVTYIKETLIDDKFKLNLVKVFQQNASVLCGFHCLFNLILFVQYLKGEINETNDNNKESIFLKKMNSSVKFWKFYREILKYLEANMNLEKSAVDSLKKEGPLERYQFKFILENNSKIKKIISVDENIPVEFYRFFYGFNNIQGMDKLEIVQLQNALEKMRDSKQNLIYVILLGIVNHWSVLIISKTRKQEIKFHYLDSLNINIFNLNSPDEISEFTHRRFEERTKLLKKTYNEWTKNCFTQWIYDINFTIKMFFQIIFKSKSEVSYVSLYDITMNVIINRILETFIKYNSIDSLENEEYYYDNKLSKEKIEVIKEGLFNWLNTEYHPKVLWSDLIRGIEIFNYRINIQNSKNFKAIKGLINYSSKLRKLIEDTYLDDRAVNRDERYFLFCRYFELIDKLKKLLDF